MNDRHPDELTGAHVLLTTITLAVAFAVLMVCMPWIQLIVRAIVFFLKALPGWYNDYYQWVMGL